MDAGINEKKSTEIANLPEAPSQRPVFYIDEDEKIINANGRVKRFSKGATVTWGVLLFLARQSKPVSNTDIKRSSREGRSLSSIPTLRTLIDKNREGPRMLKRFGWKETSTYLLDADVRFIDKSHPDWERIFAIPKEEEKMLPGERQRKAISVFFALNKDKTAFRDKSTAAVIRAIYSERFSEELDSEQIKKIFERCFRNFMSIRRSIIAMLSKSETTPLDKWSPAMVEFIGWLRTQSEYAKASVEDLILVVRRKISFEELKRKTALSLSISVASNDGNSAKSAPVVSTTSVEVGAKAVNTPVDGNSKEETTPTPCKLALKEFSLFLSLVFPSGINNKNALGVNFRQEQRDSLGEIKRRYLESVGGKEDAVDSREIASLNEKLRVLVEEPEEFLKQNTDEERIALGFFDTIICNISKNDWKDFLKKVGFS